MDLLDSLAALDDELCTWPDEPRLFTRANGADQWPDPVTPLTQTAVVEPQIRALPDTFTDRLGLIDRAPVHDCAGVFYGFVALISVGLIYSYRQQMKDRQYLLYGLGCLFIMGLGIRAMLIHL